MSVSTFIIFYHGTEWLSKRTKDNTAALIRASRHTSRKLLSFPEVTLLYVACIFISFHSVCIEKVYRKWNYVIYDVNRYFSFLCLWWWYFNFNTTFVIHTKVQTYSDIIDWSFVNKLSNICTNNVRLYDKRPVINIQSTW